MHAAQPPTVHDDEDPERGSRPHRLALPHKGVLAPGARRLLIAAGYRCGTPLDRLQHLDSDNDAEFLYLRARDVPALVASGVIDVGITGRDFVADSCCEVTELLRLGFGHSTVHYAVPVGTGTGTHCLQGWRIATALPELTARDLAARGIQAEVVAMTGAVENAIHIGIADAIADVVDSGRTLAANGLQIIGSPLIRSEAVLIASARHAGTASARRLTSRLITALCTAA